MPNLINVLKEPAQSTAPGNQMEWGTCLVFTCENDCCMDVEAAKKRELKECWQEEVVLVQWED
jgi:pre-rRNA-processing protein TSR4